MTYRVVEALRNVIVLDGNEWGNRWVCKTTAE